MFFCEFSPTPPPPFLFLETEGNFPGLMALFVIARVLEGMCPFFFIFFSQKGHMPFLKVPAFVVCVSVCNVRLCSVIGSYLGLCIGDNRISRFES